MRLDDRHPIGVTGRPPNYLQRASLFVSHSAQSEGEGGRSIEEMVIG